MLLFTSCCWVGLRGAGNQLRRCGNQLQLQGSERPAMVGGWLVWWTSAARLVRLLVGWWNFLIRRCLSISHFSTFAFLQFFNLNSHHEGRPSSVVGARAARSRAVHSVILNSQKSLYLWHCFNFMSSIEIFYILIRCDSCHCVLYELSAAAQFNFFALASLKLFGHSNYVLHSTLLCLTLIVAFAFACPLRRHYFATNFFTRSVTL